MRLERRDLPPLYALTDPSGGDSPGAVVKILIEAGIQWIQLRVKDVPDKELYAIVEESVGLLPAKVRLFVNDRSDVAVACEADGVHLGDRDLPPSAAREVARDRPLLIGYSTHAVEEAINAGADPDIDYVALGPIFKSPTKGGREPLGLEALAAARARVIKPIVAIGGISSANVKSVLDAGADSVAVISALYRGGTVAENTMRLLEAIGTR